MALEHQNISIGEADAATAAATAQSAWRDALVDHASGAWSLEEEFDSSGGTVHWVVVKNDHAVSGQDLDFFVCIGRVVATGVMGCFVGEEYTAASNVLNKFAPRSDNTGYILADGSYQASVGAGTATFTLGTTLPGTTNGSPLCENIACSATQRLFTSVDMDYAVLNVNGTTMYVGYMVDLIVPKTGLVATPAICCGNLTHGSMGRFASITNHPIIAADAPMNAQMPHSFIPVISGGYMDMVLSQNQAMLTAIYGYPDRYQNDRVAASEVCGIMATATEQGYGLTVTRADKVGGLRAKFKGLRYTTGPLAAVAYDDLVVDSKKAVVIYAFGNLQSNSPYQQFLVPYNYGSVVRPYLTVDTGIAA